MFKKTFFPKAIVLSLSLSLSLCLFFISPIMGITTGETDSTSDNTDKNESLFTEKVEVVGHVPIVKTIQSVSVFKKEEIEKFNFESLKSVLNLTPGLLTLSNGSFGQASSTSIRGSKTTQVLYIVDGIKLRDGSNLGGVSLAVLSPNIVDKVEVVRGPLSNIYGSDAMGGVISIDTLSKPGTRLMATFGSFGSYSGTVSQSIVKKNLDAGFSINTQRYTDNEVNDVFKNTGITSRLVFKNKKLSAGLRFFGNFTDSGIPYNDFGAPSSQRKFKNTYAILSLPFEYSFNEQNRLDVKLAYTKSEYRFNDPQDQWSSYFKNRFDNIETEATYMGRFFEKLDFRAGLDYSNQTILNENNYGRTLDNSKMNYVSGFASGALDLDPFQISTSIRFDKYKDIALNVSPQVGISYLLAHKYKFRAAFSESFLAPMVSQSINPWGKPNYNLEPEKAASIEFGFDYFSSSFVFSASYFITRYKDMIDWVTVDWTTFQGQFQNVNRVNLEGLELSTTVQPITNLTVTGSYTYLHSEDKATGKPLARKPKHIAAGSATYINKHFSLSGSMIYVGKRPDYDYAIWPPDIMNPSFDTFNFTLEVPVLKTLSLFGKITNTFNKEYQEIYGYHSPGRRFEIGVKYEME